MKKSELISIIKEELQSIMNEESSEQFKDLRTDTIYQNVRKFIDTLEILNDDNKRNVDTFKRQLADVDNKFPHEERIKIINLLSHLQVVQSKIEKLVKAHEEFKKDIWDDKL